MTKYLARVPLPVRLRIQGDQFIRFAGTISRLTGDEHVSTEDSAEAFVVIFTLEASTRDEARGEARAAVGAGLQAVGLGDLEFFSATVEEAS